MLKLHNDDNFATSLFELSMSVPLLDSHTVKVTFDEFVDICRQEQPTSEEELIKAFRKIDVNGDGYISNSELRKTLTTVSLL